VGCHPLQVRQCLSALVGKRQVHSDVRVRFRQLVVVGCLREELLIGNFASEIPHNRVRPDGSVAAFCALIEECAAKWPTSAAHMDP
jgi:hypothetical protein